MQPHGSHPEGSPYALAARRAKRAEAGALGIDEAFVSSLVDQFYARVRGDPALGPIFAARVKDWEHHLDRMKRFWRSVLFSSGEFFGNPMLKHMAIPGLHQPLFDRWLKLFEQSLDDLGNAEARDHVHGKARAIAASLLHGIEGFRERR